MFHVRDTGLGLTAEQKEKLFQPFSQADVSTTRQFGGTGLGLSICKQLTELWKGEIGVESEGLGRGCHFWATLPLRPSPTAAAPVSPPEITKLPKAVAVVDGLRERKVAMQQLFQCFSSRVEVFASAVEISPIQLQELSLLVVLPGSDPEQWPQAKARLSSLLEVCSEELRVMGFAAMGELQKAEEFFGFPMLPKPPTFAQIQEFLGSSQGMPSARPSPVLSGVLGYTPDAEAPASKRVLIAEDIKLNQTVVTQMLKRWNIVADTADNGLEAVSMCRLRCYDAVFMDCHMPLCDGFEATRRIRQLEGYGEVPIVALTAATMGEDRAACQQCGMTYFLAKPVTLASLRALLVEASII